MWSDWLADTLNRSPVAVPDRESKPHRVSDVSGDLESADSESGDWEAVTGLLIHEGFGVEYRDT